MIQLLQYVAMRVNGLREPDGIGAEEVVVGNVVWFDSRLKANLKRFVPRFADTVAWKIHNAYGPLIFGLLKDPFLAMGRPRDTLSYESRLRPIYPKLLKQLGVVVQPGAGRSAAWAQLTLAAVVVVMSAIAS